MTLTSSSPQPVESRSAGQVLIDQLVLNGATHAFGVPGESYLAVLDALLNSPISFVTTRHESAAANMAEAYGKLTGRPGLCLVTRGPGATQASVGVHTATQDSTPMILLIGQVARGHSGREGFQEVDLAAFFRPLAKWSVQIDDAARIPELIARAYHTAMSGRPGPVVVALPEDMLEEPVQVPDAPVVSIARAAPSHDDVARVSALLETARSPLIIVGEGGWTAATGENAVAFATQARVPIAASFRCQDFVDNSSEVYAGHLGLGTDSKLASRLADADLLIFVGGRLDEVTTAGYTRLEVPVPRQPLVHVHPDPDQLGTVYQPELAIVSGAPELFAALRAHGPGRGAALRAGLIERAHSEYMQTLTPTTQGGAAGAGVNLSEAMAVLRDRLPSDAILTSGAGNFSLWAHRFYSFTGYPTQLAPRSGAMGYGFPAAICAKALHPTRTVVCIAGDGDFQMAGQELATAVQEKLAVIVVIVDNQLLGTIRMHQERRYPGRVIGTTLVNPDFAKLARAFGANGSVAGSIGELREALDEALTATVPTVIDLKVDPSWITPSQTLDDLRDRA